MSIPLLSHHCNQLELFEDRISQKPYCTDQLGHIVIRSKRSAIKYRYIQANSPNETQCLVFDIDRPGAAVDWEDLGAPAPSIIARNPENGHAHLFYLLETPIHHNHTSRKNPIRYLASVEASLRDKLQADPAYCGLITKNPIHPYWEVLLHQPHPYSLGWIADWLDLSKYSDKRKNLPAVGLGRNCTVFDRTRVWAYTEIRKPQAWFGFDFWFCAVMAKAMAVNANFPEPMTEREVKGIAKSIAKWVWKNMDSDGFKAWCSRRGEASGRARAKIADEKLALILEAKARRPDASNRTIAIELGMAESSVRSRLKRCATNHFR